MELLITAIALAWIACGVLAYGLTFAHFQSKFPIIAAECRGVDQRFAAFIAFMGPVGLLVALLMGNPRKHGLRYR